MIRLNLPARPRILVITLRRLGDVLLTTPPIRSLRRVWPDAIRRSAWPTFASYGSRVSVSTRSPTNSASVSAWWSEYLLRRIRAWTHLWTPREMQAIFEEH